MISNPRSPIISAKGKVKTFALDHVELAISLKTLLDAGSKESKTKERSK